MNAKQLRHQLSLTFEGIQRGEVKPQTAQALSAVAGRMVGTAVAQIQYYKQRNEIPDIDFLKEE